MLLHLPGQGIHAQVRRLFKRTALLTDNDIIPGHLKFYLYDLILGVAGLVQFQKNLTSEDIIIIGYHLIDLFLDEINQFTVCVKVDGLDGDLHSALGVKPWDGRVYRLL